MGRERVKIFAVDETGITVAGMQAFLFIAYEPFEDRILGLHLAWTPSSLSAELFLKDLVKKYGRHPVWTDGAEWYSLACDSMNLLASRIHAWILVVGGHRESSATIERQD